MKGFVNLSPLKKAWSLLDESERRSAIRVLALMIVAAFSAAAMVGSVFPFLSVLADPEMIENVPAFRWMYNIGGFETRYSFLVALGLGAIIVIVLSNFILVLNAWSLNHYMSNRIHSISHNLFAHYLAQPYAFFLGSHSGDMASNILLECKILVEQYLQQVATIFSTSLTILAVMAMLVIVNPLVTTVAIGTFIAFYGGVMLVSRRYVRKLGRRRALADKARFSIAGEAFGGIKDLKLLGRESAYLDRYDVSSLEMARSQIGVAVVAQTPHYAIQVLGFGGIIVLCLALLDPTKLQEREALGGFLPIVGLMAFAAQRLMPELGKLYNSITHMTAGMAALDRVYQGLHHGEENVLEYSSPTPLGLASRLELEGVNYTYPNADRAGLSDVTLSIRAGERIGIVGTSGAGKTTLADVFLGLLIPDKGIVRVDGVPITEDNLRAWQQTVGYVPQDIFLIDASLSENIALGLPSEEIDINKLERSARIAQLHDFVMSELPEGYATRIGERGVRLSGGQRQRIGIARALYQDADLIVLDEATSALDNLMEREVMAAVEALPGDKTLILIAHRLSTVKTCNRIVMMERGQVSGFGSWSELVNQNSLFCALSEAN